MGVRGEIFSTRVMCEGRSYFFNVKENRMGDLFLAIVESKPTETETFERRSIVIFRENLQEFLKSLEKALEAIDKVPVKKASKKSERHSSAEPSLRDADSGPAPRKGRSEGEGSFSLLPEGRQPSGKSGDRAASKPGKRVIRPRSAEAERRVPRPPASDRDSKPTRRVTVKRAKPRD